MDKSRQPLLHRDEPPHSGGAHRYRDGHRRGPGAGPDSHRRGLSPEPPGDRPDQTGATCTLTATPSSAALPRRIPSNNFAPDTGKITAVPLRRRLRRPSGRRQRLGVGTVISPYYDSLLVKVTSWDQHVPCRVPQGRPRHQRGPRPRRQDQHPLCHQHSGPSHVPSAGSATPSSSTRRRSCLRSWTAATAPPRVLRYIAEDPGGQPQRRAQAVRHPPFPARHRSRWARGLKQLLDAKGPEAVKRWVLEQKKLLLTDTTMRDAHQSLLSTRMRTRDMVKGADGVADILRGLLLAGDVGRRHLRRGLPFPPRVPVGAAASAAGEDPQHPVPDAAAGRQSAVGYTNYPDNLVRAFVKEAAQRRHRCVPRLRLPELDPRHGGGHGRGAQAEQAAARPPSATPATFWTPSGISTP